MGVLYHLFTILCLKFCYFAGASSNYSICVCNYLQNVKLQISVFGIHNIEYKKLMSKLYATLEIETIHICKYCIRKKGLNDILNGAGKRFFYYKSR